MTDMLSDERERWLVRGLQLVLLGISAYGLSRGQTGILVNGLVSFGVTLVPAFLRQDTSISLDVTHVLVLSVAVVVHAVGALGLYQTIPWYDSVAHALSASIVAGAGYATVKAVDRNSEQTTLPAGLQFAFILVFVMAFGVFWEILEFGTGLASELLGGEPVLAQYGLDDIVYDLVFNQVGAVVVAGWDAARPQGAADEATEAMDD
ncbi:hypothetical protein [Halorussus litoreus]|uniref:hypothetical protein n=1 Tax=Halorussus litoreus TaxID=1710536 RepID=UPI000E246E56|nr:hypothetical protein [Halorussus litoreus]